MSNKRPGAGGSPPIVRSVERRAGVAALDMAAQCATKSLTSQPSLFEAIVREKDKVRRALKNHSYRVDETPNKDIATGPVLAILLDPVIGSLTGEQRDARLRQIIEQTRPLRPRYLRGAQVLVTLMGVLVIGAMFLTGGASPVFVMGIIGMVLMLWAATPDRHALNIIPVNYPTISLAQAQHLAELPSAAVTDVSGMLADHSRDIAEVHAAIAELDREWLEYQLDLHDWWLAKPQLRNDNDPAVREFRDAQYELRELAQNLSTTSTGEQVSTALAAARRALKAWGAANTRALALGVTGLGASEEAALHTLYGLASQLNDPHTPEAQCPQIVNHITRIMPKLVTVPCTLADIAVLPAIERRLKAIAPPDGDWA
ncbi:hypothetical protein MTY66_60940 (plasmid) [Mycolicibacterium sp. TY66]|uniref:hypothetical protein n=1 Tax=unclassified Mycolicibacterium TaxID=2636767 RepID=UPI001BB3BB93|nr:MULTISPECIES: hypothetical protein [unclassified Mycolicibacterium]BCI84469.1 hypothetical protein MTY66_60940 [Mycolicibacterium sp. TY66]BCJ84701.1 hypothetical protein MTY81_60740 [Mycolicibacterium sp. TY81]